MPDRSRDTDPRERLPAIFLRARWVKLAMLNYEVDPALLAARVPSGTELDTFAGRNYVSLVAFHFLDTRVLGIPIPFHRDFLEANLRFYVKRVTGGELRRGVVFIKEIVPRRAIAWVANAVYNESYVALPMSFSADADRLTYTWRQGAREHALHLRSACQPYLPAADSEASFIAEHYFGYARQRDGSTVEYRVEHPAWRVEDGIDARFDSDVTSLYGAEFGALLSAPPHSSFLAEGSPIIVRRGRRL